MKAILLLLAFGFLAENAYADNFLFGVGMHAGQGKISMKSAQFLLKEGGFNSFRDEVYWARVERVPGVLKVEKDLVDLDELIQVEKAGAPVLLVLDYGNRFYDEGRQPTSKIGLDGFTRYVQYIASRYSSAVFGFEVWNEWNIGSGNPSPHARWGDPSAYVELVKRSADVIRRLAPKSKILCGSVADRDLKWIRAILQLGVSQYCDGISVHPYVFSNGTHSRPSDVFDWIDELHSIIQHNTSKPIGIYITELGWPNHIGKGGHDRWKVSDYLAQSFLLAKERPYVHGLWWYELVDSGNNIFDREHNFGLVHGNYSYKPAFVVAKALSSILVDASFIKSGNLSDGRRWARFLLPTGENLAAVWTTDLGVKTIKVKSPVKNLLQVALQDGIRKKLGDAKDIPVSGLPIFLIFSGDELTLE